MHRMFANLNYSVENSEKTLSTEQWQWRDQTEARTNAANTSAVWKYLKYSIMGYERFIFCFLDSPTTGWHVCKVKKTLKFSSNMHLFLMNFYSSQTDSFNDSSF